MHIGIVVSPLWACEILNLGTEVEMILFSSTRSKDSCSSGIKMFQVLDSENASRLAPEKVRGQGCMIFFAIDRCQPKQVEIALGNSLVRNLLEHTVAGNKNLPIQVLRIIFIKPYHRLANVVSTRMGLEDKSVILIQEL
jgi:hypothetical protein